MLPNARMIEEESPDFLLLEAPTASDVMLLDAVHINIYNIM